MKLPSRCSSFFEFILQPYTVKKTVSAAVALAIGLMFTLSSTYAAEPYSVSELKQEVAKFLAHEYEQPSHERVEITLGNLDNRLRMNRCGGPLQMSTKDQAGLGGNLSVQVQCSDVIPWSIHVPAQVYIFKSIPVAVRNLARGTIISAADIDVSTINISTIRQEFLFDLGAAVGKELKRNISEGEPLRSGYLDAPTTIKRGEMVSVETNAGGIRVSSIGTAMTDGRTGQQVRIRNNQSERIITAIVAGPGQAYIH